MAKFLCTLIVISEVDEYAVEISGDTEQEAREDLQRQHGAWEVPEIMLSEELTNPSDSQLVDIFEALHDEELNEEFYSSDGFEEVSINASDGEAYIRWSASFDFQIDGIDIKSTSDEIEDFVRRCLKINGLRVEKVEIGLDGI